MQKARKQERPDQNGWLVRDALQAWRRRLVGSLYWSPRKSGRLDSTRRTV